MYKKPPDEDQKREYPEFTYPAQRRKRPVATYKQPSNVYYADEHPEVPRFKRASLNLDKQQHQARSHTSSREHHSHRPFVTLLQQLSHSRIFIIICIVALILVISAQIMVNLSHNYSAISLSGWGNTNPKQPQAIGQVSTNPHKLVIVPQDIDHPAPPVLATSAYLLDAGTGTTVYAYNPFMHLPMLSTTKLMTASLAVEQGNLDRQITITNAMSKDISQLSADSALFGVKKGETYTLRELLYGLLFVSGNDAAIAIADALGGNLQNFVAQMNQKAHDLGMDDTHFVNPHGLLDPGQYSCAYDLSLLGRYSMSLPVLHKISGEISYHIPQGGNHPERFLLNGNQFLWWYPGVDGGKTGYDGHKNFIQVMSVTRNHHHLIGVVMNTNNWWTDMRDLMNWGFGSFTWISPRDVDANQHPIIYDDVWNYFASDTKDITIPTTNNGRYYIYTGLSVSGSIMTYFDKNGGLTKFGYPTKMPATTGVQIISQQFEHATIQCNLATGLCQTI